MADSFRSQESLEKTLPKRFNETYRQRNLILSYADSATYNCSRIVGLLNILVVYNAHLVSQKMPLLKDTADGYP